MPTGNNTRLHAVLQAGQAHVRATGIEPDPGSPPQLGMLGAAAKAASDGFAMIRGPAPGKPTRKDIDDNGKQVLPKSSEVVKDLVATYKKDAEARAKALDKARAEAKVCAESRTKAVNEYQQDAEKAALAAIKELYKRLAETEAARDKLQSASEASLAKLDDMVKVGGQSSAKVEELTKAITLLRVEKQSVVDELATLKKTCNQARDAAAALAETKLKELNAEWSTKLEECKSKNASSGADAAKQLEEALGQLKLAQENLLDETKELALLREENATQTKELLAENVKQEELFRKAAIAACDALKAYTQKK